MLKSDLIKKVSECTGLSQDDSTRAINAVFGIIANETSKRNSISIPDFGKFQVKVCPARKGRNPRTNEEITIPEREKIVFKPFDNFTRYAFKYLPTVPE